MLPRCESERSFYIAGWRLKNEGTWEKWYCYVAKNCATQPKVRQRGVMVTYGVVCYCGNITPRFWEYFMVIYLVVDLQRLFFIFKV
jgi:hypothetical protein